MQWSPNNHAERKNDMIGSLSSKLLVTEFYKAITYQKLVALGCKREEVAKQEVLGWLYWDEGRKKYDVYLTSLW